MRKSELGSQSLPPDVIVPKEITLTPEQLGKLLSQEINHRRDHVEGYNLNGRLSSPEVKGSNGSSLLKTQ